jgi:cytidine deaminase
VPEVDLEIVETAAALVSTRTDGCYHTTAAAARARDGSVLSGINVFHFTGGPCAELVLHRGINGTGELQLQVLLECRLC